MNPAFAVVVPFAAWELWRAAPRGAARASARRAGAAAAAVTVPIALWLLAAGALDDFCAQVLGHAAALVRAREPERRRVRRPRHRRLDGVRFLLNVPAGGLWVAGLSACAIACRTASCGRRRSPRPSGSCVAWLRVKSASYEFPHHYYPALPGIAAGIALGIAALWQPAAGQEDGAGRSRVVAGGAGRTSSRPSGRPRGAPARTRSASSIRWRTSCPRRPPRRTGSCSRANWIQIYWLVRPPSVDALLRRVPPPRAPVVRGGATARPVRSSPAGDRADAGRSAGPGRAGAAAARAVSPRL